jgi:WXG100 family type VII secretion target
MTGDRIEVNCQTLNEIALQFDREMQVQQALLSQTRARLSALYQSDWRGVAADAFMNEMEGSVLPGYGRLVEALKETSQVTKQIIQTFQQGEEEAAAVFKGNSSLFTSAVKKANGYIWDNIEGGLKYEDSLNSSQQSPELSLKIPLWQDQVWGIDGSKTTELGGLRAGWKGEVSAVSGEAGLGFGLNDKGDFIGGFGKITGAEASTSVALGLGIAGLGVGLGVGAKALEGEVFAGYKDGEVGAKIGATLAAVDATVGLNVFGKNVGVTGEVGLKFELGLTIGKKTELDLGLFSIGLELGDQLGFDEAEKGK